jgi:hypothetical protein
VLEEGIDAGMLEDEVLHGIANVRCTKHPTLVGTRVRGGGGASTYGSRSAPSRRQYGFVTSAKPVIWPPFFGTRNCVCLCSSVLYHTNYQVIEIGGKRKRRKEKDLLLEGVMSNQGWEIEVDPCQRMKFLPHP